MKPQRQRVVEIRTDPRPIATCAECGYLAWADEGTLTTTGRHRRTVLICGDCRPAAKPKGASR